MTHEPHCPVPRAEDRGESAVCLCRPWMALRAANKNATPIFNGITRGLTEMGFTVELRRKGNNFVLLVPDLNDNGMPVYWEIKPIRKPGVA